MPPLLPRQHRRQNPPHTRLKQDSQGVPQMETRELLPEEGKWLLVRETRVVSDGPVIPAVPAAWDALPPLFAVTGWVQETKD